MLLFIFDIYKTTSSFQLHDSKKNISYQKLIKASLTGCILKCRLPNLDTIITVTKVKKGFLKKKKVKGFFISMTMLSFKQVESNYGKRGSCERGCSWIIKFSHCLNFGYCQYGIIIFSI